jgi:hypothetical protein
MSKPLILEDAKDESAAADDVIAEGPASQLFAVRETQRLYRLKAARCQAVVAADTENEARTIAARHDALRGDWSDPEFASSEFEDTGESHVFGDLIISALAAPRSGGDKKSLVIFFDRSKVVRQYTIISSKVDVSQGLIAR